MNKNCIPDNQALRGHPNRPNLDIFGSQTLLYKVYDLAHFFYCSSSSALAPVFHVHKSCSGSNPVLMQCFARTVAASVALLVPSCLLSGVFNVRITLNKALFQCTCYAEQSDVSTEYISRYICIYLLSLFHIPSGLM